MTTKTTRTTEAAGKLRPRKPAAPGALLISLDEAATMLGVCSRTLRSLAQRGEVRVVRIGRRVLIHRDQLAHLAEHGTAEQVTPRPSRHEGETP